MHLVLGIAQEFRLFGEIIRDDKLSKLVIQLYENAVAETTRKTYRTGVKGFIDLLIGFLVSRLHLLGLGRCL